MAQTPSPSSEPRDAVGDAARRETWGSVASLIVAIGVAAGCVAYYANSGDPNGLTASGFGAAACLLGAAAALFAPMFVSQSQRTLVRASAGLLLRAGLPLIVIFWARAKRPELVDSGLLTTVMAVYFVGWAVEVGWRIAFRGRSETDRETDSVAPTTSAR